METQRIKVIATVGPASDKPEMLKAMIKSGVNIFRFNFSHGNQSYFRSIIKNVRAIDRNLGTKTTMFIDLPGPKFRTGKLENEPFQIKKGHVYRLGPDADIPVDQAILKKLNVHKKILISDGKLELRPIKFSGKYLLARAENDLLLRNEQSINSPSLSYSKRYPTNKDIEGIRFGLKNGIDTFALSFVASAEDISKARRITGKSSNIIAKIERKEAVENFHSILEVSDIIMVARGDLGLNMDIAEVPEIQKKLIYQSNKAGRPVITATQMLESMTSSITPTRAEVDDIFTAIEEGTDAVMLSEETAIGDYPLKSVQMIRHVINKFNYSSTGKRAYTEETLQDSILDAAVELVHKTGIKDIAVVTATGESAFKLSRYDLAVRIFALARSDTVLDKLSFGRGIIGIKYTTVRGEKAIVSYLRKRFKIRDIILISAPRNAKNLHESVKIYT